jgi:hypothetical protein
MLQLPEIQEFVAEARGRHALMTTRRARRYQRGSICKSQNGEIWYGKYYPAPGAPQKRVQLGRCSEMNEKQARTGLDDIIAQLNRNPAHALGAEPVRRFVEQVFIRKSTKTETGAERQARRPSIYSAGRSCRRSANCVAAISRPRISAECCANLRRLV